MKRIKFRDDSKWRNNGVSSRAKKALAPVLALIVALVLALGLTLPMSPSASASPGTIVLASDTATQCGGYTTTNPEADPLNVASYGGTWNPAVAVDTTGLVPDWWYDNSPLPPAVWVSSAEPREGSPLVDQWRLFKEDFTIPPGSSGIPVSLSFTADNAVAVYLVNNDNPTGILIATTPAAPPTYPDLVYGPSPYGAYDPQHNQTLFQSNFVPKEGLNTLMFVVRNWGWPIGDNPTGLLYRAEIAETTEIVVGGEIYAMDFNKPISSAPWVGLGLILAAGACIAGILVIKRRGVLEA